MQEVIWSKLFFFFTTCMSDNCVESLLESFVFFSSKIKQSLFPFQPKLMDERQPCFPLHLCLHPCCIEFQTRAQSSLVPPDRTSVSIRVLLMRCCISLFSTIFGQLKRVIPLSFTISHIVHIGEHRIILDHVLLRRWFTCSLKPYVSIAHALKKKLFSHLLPTAEAWKLLHLLASDKVRSYMMNSWCADSQHNLEKHLDGLPRFDPRCFPEDNTLAVRH